MQQANVAKLADIVEIVAVGQGNAGCDAGSGGNGEITQEMPAIHAGSSLVNDGGFPRRFLLLGLCD